MNAGLFSIDALATLENDIGQAIPALDYEAILDDAKAVLQKQLAKNPELAGVDVTALPESDSLNKILEVLAYRELITRQNMNEALKGCYLSSARGTDLLNLAELILCEKFEHIAGTDEQNDSILRESIVAEFRNIHTAGSRKAYQALALQAARPFSVMTAVHVESPRAGVVQLKLLYTPKAKGSLKTQSLEAVQTALRNESVRPIGQHVLVEDANIISYRVRARLGFRDRLGVNEALSSAHKAVKNLIHTRYAFGSEIYRSAVLSALHQPGVDYIILENLKDNNHYEDVVVGRDEAAWCDFEHIEISLNTAPPSEMISGAEFKNTQHKRERLNGKVIIIPPKNEIQLTEYSFYWGDKKGQRLLGQNRIGTMPVGGTRTFTFSQLSIPSGAVCFLIYTVNENGEMSDNSLKDRHEHTSAGFELKFPERNHS